MSADEPSIFVGCGEKEVHDVPMSVICRPIPSVLDQEKVANFQDAIQNGAEMTPLEVLWVEEPPGSNYYFALGGCHRWEAYTRLKSPTVPAHLIRVPPSTITHFLGSSSPFFKRNMQQ
ncbi:sulfiredoxin [Dunaliella salina]|uniref:Sulfiredoxin n=1 Tax=Dunaliella salina TaxID=3046 RepID=A0ABQ7GIG2_DUNSA|nr:sulfiredoxin [Dunaliella salina]|eukprot:KAF5834408.1 sulfiredoxin [Dunaliella salina]